MPIIRQYLSFGETQTPAGVVARGGVVKKRSEQVMLREQAQQRERVLLPRVREQAQ